MSYHSTVLADNPVAYFPLDEPGLTVLDATAHGYTGTCDVGVSVGSVPFAGSGPGKLLPDATPGGALHDSPRIALAATLGPWPIAALPHSPGGFTYEAWMRTPVPGQLGQFWPAVVQGPAAAGALPEGSYLWAIRALGGADTLRLELRSAAPLGFGVFDAAPTLDDGWHHLTATWDGTTAALYYDCITVPHSTSLLPQGAFIASSGRIGGVHSDGNLTAEYAHMALYAYPLTPTQVLAHCAAARPDLLRLTHAPGGSTQKWTVPVGRATRIIYNG